MGEWRTLWENDEGRTVRPESGLPAPVCPCPISEKTVRVRALTLAEPVTGPLGYVLSTVSCSFPVSHQRTHVAAERSCHE
jgi:hypothetical protein